MPSRQPRLQRFLLSPGVSLIAGAVGAALMFGHWWALLASILMAAAMVTQIKALTLFRGRNYPFIGLFMLLQAALTPDITGILLALTALFSLILLLRCFLAPQNTRTFFLINLLCGLGALYARSFAFLALLLLLCLILVRAFSLRGLMASVLGFITPAILILPFDLQRFSALHTIYASRLVPGWSVPLTVVAAIAFLSVIATFLPAYGYPAQARARNMTILGLAVGALALPFLDFAHAPAYFALLNLTTAYCLTHLASLRRHSWPYILLTWIITLVIYTNQAGGLNTDVNPERLPLGVANHQ